MTLKYTCHFERGPYKRSECFGCSEAISHAGIRQVGIATSLPLLIARDGMYAENVTVRRSGAFYCHNEGSFELKIRQNERKCG